MTIRAHVRNLRRPRRSLRTTVTAAAAVTALIVVALAGIVIASRLHSQDLHQVDQELRSRVSKVSADATKLVESEQSGDTSGGVDHDAAGLDAGSQNAVLVYRGKVLISTHGDVGNSVPAPSGDGYRTISVGGQEWRSLVVSIGGGRIQLLQSLAPVQQRLTDTEQIVTIVAALATLVTAIAVWLATGVALDPLRRLRAGAASIRADRAHDRRLPLTAGPHEIAELTITLNGMLDELDASMQSTRRFTADAGHELRNPLSSLGIDLETLRRNPDLPTDQRTATLDAMTNEHARLVRVLDGLQELARGDAHALPETTTIDVAVLVEQCVSRSRRLHPGAEVALIISSAARSATITGWPDGLSSAVANLLDNAARHGRPGGAIAVTMDESAKAVTITVDDDGAGISPDARDAMLGRFTRGDTSATGSGLGLAIAQQQVALHSGTLSLETSPDGGLRVRLLLPLTPS
jgi:signal transduction histidine kinase